MTMRTERAQEMLEWIADWRDGQFEPAYYNKKWPVEMYGLAEAAEQLANDVLALTEALTSRGYSLADPIGGAEGDA